eukprot:scaffold205098_cov40-Attheya_sp.AAC.2
MDAGTLPPNQASKDCLRTGQTLGKHRISLVANFPANFKVGSRAQDKIKSVDRLLWYIDYEEHQHHLCSLYAMHSIAICVLLVEASNPQIGVTFDQFRPVWSA